MRRLLFHTLPALILAAMSVSAQPMIIADRYELGGFLSPSLSYSRIIDQPAYSLGAAAALVIDHTTVIGVEGRGLFDGVGGYAGADGAKPALRMFSAALLLEKIDQPNDPLHLLWRAAIGGGYFRWHTPEQESTVTVDRQDGFILLEPGIGVEYNAASGMRIGLSGRYRFIGGIELEGLDGRDAETFVVELMFRFGSF